jgi:hypothetical protein
LTLGFLVFGPWTGLAGWGVDARRGKTKEPAAGAAAISEKKPQEQTVFQKISGNFPEIF